MIGLLRVALIIVGMVVNEILARLGSLGDDARRGHNAKAGAADNQFGVKLGDIRAIASGAGYTTWTASWSAKRMARPCE